MATQGNRTFTITPDDHSGIVVVTATLLMTWSLLCLGIRLYNRLVLSSTLGLDDLASGLSTLFGVVQTIVACIGVSHGFGKSARLLQSSQVDTINAYEYAVELLCLIGIGFSKISIVCFYLRITPQRAQRVVCYGLVGLSATWIIAVASVAATRCGNNEPEKIFDRICNDYNARWTAITATDCLLEIAIFCIPVWILWDLRTSFSYKVTILLSFASRLFVIVASTLHAKYVGEWQTSKFDPIAAVTPFIWLQVETSYAIMSATFPTLGTVLKSLNTRWGALDGPDVAQYAMSSLSRSRDGAKNGISSRSRRETDSGPPRLRPEGGGYTFRVRNQQQEVSSGLARKNSDDSDQMIIRKTVSTSVEHQGLG